LTKIQCDLQQNLQQYTISTAASEKTNANSKKPDILRQLFRAFVSNNRTPNGRQKSNLTLLVEMILIMVIHKFLIFLSQEQYNTGYLVK
jgi:hypothetical protein